MRDWIETTIGEFCPFEYGKGLKETDRHQGDQPVFGSNGYIGTHDEACVKSRGVIIGRKGTVGAVHYSDKPFWPIDTTFYIEETKGRDIRYIYYLLKSIGLGSMNSDSAVPGLNRSAAHARKIKVPSYLEEQQAIAMILGTLDDKIELNRRMNATLESMARAVFKAWFVDNEEAKEWKVGTVGEDFNLTMGQSPPGETYNEEKIGMPFFQGRTDFGFRFPTNRIYCSAPTRFAKPGDTLVSVRAPVGDINMAAEECAVGRGVAAIRHKTGSRSYTYYSMHLLKEEFNRFEAEGTVFGSINKADFQALKVKIPSPEKILKFEEICYPIDQQIENNEKQSRTLAALRDALLPRLMSGEVRVAVHE